MLKGIASVLEADDQQRQALAAKPLERDVDMEFLDPGSQVF